MQNCRAFQRNGVGTLKKNQREGFYLKSALELYETERLAGLPSEAQLRAVTFSAEFERRMNRMILNRKQQEEPIPFLRSLGRRAACFLLVCLGLTFGVFGVKAVADPSFLLTAYETFSTLVFPVDKSQSLQCREPSWIPDGFEEIRQIPSEDGLYTVYQNASGAYFSIEQSTQESAVHYLDTEGARTEQIPVGDRTGLFIQKDSRNTLVWKDSQNTFIMQANIPQEEMRRIAESIGSP